MHDLAARLRSGRSRVAGVLSGTSADGIDVALTEFPDARPGHAGAPRLVAFDTVAFPAPLAARVRAILDGRAPSLGELALLSRDLGLAFGRAAREFAQAHGAGDAPGHRADSAPEHGAGLELVASHGQTVWHHDGIVAEGRASLQLGEGDFVAEAAGCAVASDFRQRDLAAGGEGAPISALADGAIFASVPRPAAILNLGGMANLTVLGADGSTLSFDTGPAGSLLDGLARRLLGAPFDDGGRRAAAGCARPELVAALSEHPFLERPPPKSTGRDTFGESYVDAVVARARTLGLADGSAGNADLLASASDFVARSVALALRRFAPRVERLVLCGGGVHNARLVEALARETRVPVASSAEHGVDPDAREALVFAVLGARLALGEPSTIPAATGALPGRILGKWSPAPPRDAEFAPPAA